MILAPVFANRVFISVTVFLCITLGSLLMQLKPEITRLIWRNKNVMLVFLLIFLSFSFIREARSTVEVFLRWQERIHYINSEKKRETSI